MNARDLTDAQRRKLIESISQRLHFHAQLLARMDGRRWQRGDPVYIAAVKAHDAVEALRKALENSGGGGRPGWMKSYGAG